MRIEEWASAVKWDEFLVPVADPGIYVVEYESRGEKIRTIGSFDGECWMFLDFSEEVLTLEEIPGNVIGKVFL